MIENRVKGAIWSYFFRLCPEASSLTVERVDLDTLNKGSAVLKIQRGDIHDIIEVLWENDRERIRVKDYSLVAVA